MRPSPKLQGIVEQLATKHKVDLSEPGACLRLYLEGHDYLVLENIGRHRISVANYLDILGTLVGDPKVVLYTNFWRQMGEEELPVWVPIEVSDLFGGWRLHAEVDPVRDEVHLYDRAGQARLALECEEVFAVYLIDHGWLRDGVRIEASIPIRTSEEILADDIEVDDWHID